ADTPDGRTEREVRQRPVGPDNDLARPGGAGRRQQDRGSVRRWRGDSSVAVAGEQGPPVGDAGRASRLAGEEPGLQGHPGLVDRSERIVEARLTDVERGPGARDQ